ncbi:MAG: response regulator [Calditrichaeota bacterium]|nr:MAG: response regulator [Calditrichota bacterium]
MSVNKSILIVDDDFNILEMIGEGLGEQGYQVQVAANPDDALRKVREHDFRFALLDFDLNTPGMTGVDLAQKIRFYQADIIVMIMTGYQNIKYAVDAMRNFKFDYLIKPFRIDQVISAFERSLREYELLEENKMLYRKILALEEEITHLREIIEEKKSTAVSMRTISQASKKLIANTKAADVYKKQQVME